MHLVVFDPRLEARRQPFPPSPWSRSRMNQPVLRPLIRWPQSHPLPLQTPHSRPGVQVISPHFPSPFFPMVGPWFTTPCQPAFQSHGAVAWRFLLPKLPGSVLFPTPGCPVTLCHILSLAQSPRLIPHPLFIPHRAAGNPVARAPWILIHPGPVSISLHGWLLSLPLFSVHLLRAPDQSGMIQSAASALICHVKVFLVYLRMRTRTQRL